MSNLILLASTAGRAGRNGIGPHQVTPLRGDPDASAELIQLRPRAIRLCPTLALAAKITSKIRGVAWIASQPMGRHFPSTGLEGRDGEEDGGHIAEGARGNRLR